MGVKMGVKKKLTVFMRDTLCTLLNLSLIFPLHMAYAENNGNKKPKEEKRTTAAGVIANILEIGKPIVEAAFKGGQSPQQNHPNQCGERELKLMFNPIQFETKYFPGCPTLPSIPSTCDICQSPPQDESQAQFTVSLYDGVRGLINLFEKYQTQGNKEGVNAGVSCINESMNKTTENLNNRLQSLDQLQANLNEAKQRLDRELKPHKKAIEELHGYLHGGKTNKGDLERKYSKLFNEVAKDKSCGAFMDHLQVEDYAKKGILNIQQEVGKVRKDDDGTDLVTHLIRNKGNIQSAIRTYANNISRHISKVGAQETLESLGEGKVNAGAVALNLDASEAVQAALKDQARFFTEEKGVIAREAAKLGADNAKDLIMGITKEGSHNFESKIRQWRNKKQNECLERKISVEDPSTAFNKFVSQFTHTDQNIRSSANIASIQREILNHLKNNRLSISEKLTQVNRLLKKKGKQKVQIMSYDTHDGATAQKNWDPAELLNVYVKACTDEYSRIKENDEGETFSQIEARARNLYAKYQHLEKNFPAKTSQEIYNRMIHCRKEGQPMPYSISSKTCGKDKLQTSSANFCLGQSLVCAQTINNCSEKIEKTTAKITSHLKMKANFINSKVMAFLNSQRNLLINLKNESLRQGENLQKIFANSPYFTPTDFTLPELKKEFSMGDLKELDVSLYNPEALMKNFEEKIEKLRSSVKDQNKLITEEMDKKKKEILASYKINLGKFEKLAGDCQDRVNDYNKMVAANQKRNRKIEQQVANFCYQYGTYASGPGCDEPLDDLEETSKEVAAHLTITQGSLPMVIGEIKKNCMRRNKTTTDADKIEEDCAKKTEQDPSKYHVCINAKTRLAELAKEGTSDEIITKNQEALQALRIADCNAYNNSSINDWKGLLNKFIGVAGQFATRNE